MAHKQTEHEHPIAENLGLDGSNRRTRRVRCWMIWGMAGLATAFIAVKWGGSNSADQLQYKTQPVRRGDLTVLVTATGTLQPTNQVDVGSELSGIIKFVEVDYNDRVGVNQVLAKLDTSKLEVQVLESKASLASARAKVLQAQATIKEARNQLKRLQEVRKMSNNKAVSQHDLDAAQAELDRAKAEEAGARAAVSQAQASLELNQTDLSKASIRSPINGVVLTRAVEPGQTVAASLQAPVLFTLAEDLTKMELHVDVDEADVGQVRQGQQATFTVDAFANRSFPAKIKQVRYGSKTVEGVVTYETVLEVDNSDLALRPGMTATADIRVRNVNDAVLVPNAALRFAPPESQERDGASGRGVMSVLIPRRRPSPPKAKADAHRAGNRQQVWTIAKGQLTAIPITTGATDGIMTEVAAGEVEPGMELVVEVESSGR
ncbi:efflux RND transporter periplasmic adaptor subunit [Desulfoferrobacter suflitae]|uniref:efflux RND transporter periplasmic adaptor subunit n=1 Tax=Desulfoferrobacter suflitae TaxID=2865782 RepID=UPI002164AD48|nr:efflux RND transporter periplasmic adaptor subunit [Desulfoferrobacter suflitae]MCK8603149.1 efflux RND transporter periplasmic adaptor subunit [Desulfoferrobacter suflitae]